MARSAGTSYDRSVPAERLVIIEFESAERAQAWYDAHDFREARAIRDGAGTWRMVIVDGV